MKLWTVVSTARLPITLPMIDATHTAWWPICNFLVSYALRQKYTAPESTTGLNLYHSFAVPLSFLFGPTTVLPFASQPLIGDHRYTIAMLAITAS